MNIQQLRTKLDQEKGGQLQLESSIERKEHRLEGLVEKLEMIEEAKFVQRTVAKKTQDELTFFISNPVELAMSSVFIEDPYGFEVEFVLRRGKTECDLFFTRGGKRCKPEDASGIGAVDVGAFALLVGLFKLENEVRKKKGMQLLRPTIIGDEFFEHLRGADQQRRCGQMVKRVSEELRLQVIMVGDVLFSVGADRIFNVVRKRKIGKHWVSEVEVSDD